MSIGGVKIKLSQVLDQGSDAEVVMLEPGELATRRARYIALFGDSPLDNAEVTDVQLSASGQRNKLGGYLWVDMGVFGPYGARIERRQKFPDHGASTVSWLKSIGRHV